MSARHLLVALLCLARPLSAQARHPWDDPVTVALPLADLALRGDSVAGVTLLAVPSSVTPMSDSAGYVALLPLDRENTTAWIFRVRALLDSLATAPGDLRNKPIGLQLPARDGGALTLAVDRNARPTSRVILLLQPAPPARTWSVRGTADDAAHLLDALTLVLGSAPGMAPMPSLSGAPREGCAEFRPPEIRHRPNFGWPTSQWEGGQVVLRFLVDSAGMPQDSTVEVILTTGPAFTKAVRRGFAGLRYQPATCDGRRVAAVREEGFGYYRSKRTFRQHY